MPESGVNFIGVSIDANWMPHYLVVEHNPKVIDFNAEGTGFLVDVRGVISNMWFTDLMLREKHEIAARLSEVFDACYQDDKQRIKTLDNLGHWFLTFNVERFRTQDNELIESAYTMYFNQHKPAQAEKVGRFNF